VQEAAGPVELAPISNVPITVKLTDKSDMVYRTIGQLAGINVLFDPDYIPKPIKVELNGVTLEEALEIAAALDAAITPKTKIVWIESPTNPRLLVYEIAAISRLAHERGALVAVDNTFATPYFQQPLGRILSSTALRNILAGTPI
jgi:histidinol-phosphate/aromatic aminotransferase/cobyric acid decarboxylase-like protein